MKKFLLFVGVACAIPFAAPAASIACGTGTLASYISLSAGCAVGGQQFFGFTALPFTAGSTNNLTPASINVTPITTGMPGLLFTLNESAGPRQLADAAIGFSVTADAGTSTLLTGSILTQNGGTATLDGDVVGTEIICLNSAFTTAGVCPASLAARNLGTFTLAGGLTQSTDSLTFATARSLIGINANFSAGGGSAGTAAVTSFAVQFSTAPAVAAVPEPSTFAALSAGLLGIGFVSRKTRKSIRSNQ